LILIQHPEQGDSNSRKANNSKEPTKAGIPTKAGTPRTLEALLEEISTAVGKQQQLRL
jgi:hypothetical protein